MLPPERYLRRGGTVGKQNPVVSVCLGGRWVETFSDGKLLYFLSFILSVSALPACCRSAFSTVLCCVEQIEYLSLRMGNGALLNPPQQTVFSDGRTGQENIHLFSQTIFKFRKAKFLADSTGPGIPAVIPKLLGDPHCLFLNNIPPNSNLGIEDFSRPSTAEFTLDFALENTQSPISRTSAF